MGGREGRKRGGLEARRKRAAENSGALPYPITMADVGFLAEYRKLSLIKCLISACFSLYSLSSLVGNPGASFETPFSNSAIALCRGIHFSHLDLTLHLK